MAHCPKCGKKLKLTDISQFCPACGVNMRFVDFEKNFYKEAKEAELSQANMHVKVKKLKASFVGSKLAIARLCVMLLPILAMLIPAGSFTISLPFSSESSTFSALGLYGLFSGSGLNYILSMVGAPVDGAAFTALRNGLFGFAAVAVFGLLIFFVSVLGFISIRNMQKINVALSVCGIAASAVAMILIITFVSAAKDSIFLEGKNGFGLIVCILMFIAVFVVNLLLVRKGIPVEYDEGMVERAEIYKKVKAGEIDIDSLPQPIVETEETRKIDEEIAKEEAAFKKKHEKEDAENGNE